MCCLYCIVGVGVGLNAASDSHVSSHLHIRLTISYQPTDIGLDILNGVIVFLQCIFVVGLRSLGTKMIDPYGDDLEDLSVINYVEGTLEICSTIMNSKQPPKKSVIAKA